jgi:hypothetical protein
MSVLRKGAVAAGQQPDIDMIPGRGIVYRPKSEYLDRDAALSDALDYYVSGIRATVVQKGDSPIWRVEAQQEGDPTDPNEDLQNTHELRVNVINPDIRANTFLLEKLGTNADSKLAWLAKIYADYAGGSRSWTDTINSIAITGATPFDLVESPFDSTDTAGIALANKVLSSWLYNNDTFIDFQYVYTHTFNFGLTSEKRSDFTNVRRVFTATQVRDAEKTPESHDLPEGEWLKLPPERVEMIGGRITLKYEYWWAEIWNPILYRRAA